MLDEGYIKYESHWTPGPLLEPSAAQQLDEWRRQLFDVGLIGEYVEEGIGFGNLSIRSGSARQFVITGTQTGHLAATTAEHYSLVTDYDIAANKVFCTGPLQASSEAMTHAAIYELNPAISAVVHVHSRSLWERLLNELPTTDPNVAYGTPEMAEEFRRLYRETNFGENGIAVMAGHDEGLVSYAESLAAASQKILALL